MAASNPTTLSNSCRHPPIVRRDAGRRSHADDLISVLVEVEEGDALSPGEVLAFVAAMIEEVRRTEIAGEHTRRDRRAGAAPPA
jgi:hypothetical protein